MAAVEMAKYRGRFFVHFFKTIISGATVLLQNLLRSVTVLVLGRSGFHFGKWCLRRRFWPKHQNPNLCSLAARLQSKVLPLGRLSPATCRADLHAILGF